MTNPHVVWRLDVARRAAAVYGANHHLAAFAVTGSVGRGHADQYSDLEVDCYWLEAPSDEDRRRPVAQLGGDLEAMWDYDDDDEEWSEDYQLDGVGVTISNFLVASAERWIDDVTARADTDRVKHMRLAAILRSVPLVGADRMEAWRALGSRYPDELVDQVVGLTLDPSVLAGWAARHALAARGDRIATYALLARIEEAVVRALLALNRTYVPHRQLKWQRSLVAGLRIAPLEVGRRLDAVWSEEPETGFELVDALLTETVALVSEHSGADITTFAEMLTERRPVLLPPA